MAVCLKLVLTPSRIPHWSQQNFLACLHEHMIFVYFLLPKINQKLYQNWLKVECLYTCMYNHVCIVKLYAESFGERIG